MPVHLEQHRFKIENTETECFSFELIEYFMREESYTLFNVEEKVLENFNHADFQIIYIYSSPLMNDAHLEDLFEKLQLMKYQLRKTFLSFRPRILVIATNSEIRLDETELPKNVHFIQVNDEDELRKHSFFKEFYPSILKQSFKGSLPLVTLNINRLSLQHVKEIHAVFNKKSFLVTVMMVALLSSMFLLDQFNPLAYKEIESLFVMNANKFSYHTLITNSFISMSPLTMIFTIFVLIQFGLLIERMYGSWRYLLILLVSTILSNTLLFAFRPAPVVSMGFTPIIYGFFGAFLYSFLVFRRLFAYTFRRILTFIVIGLLIFIILFETGFIMALIGAFVGGVITSFIVGIPYARNSTFKNRFTSGILLIALVIMGLFIGMKGM